MEQYYMLLKEQMEEALRDIENRQDIKEYAAGAIRVIGGYIATFKQYLLQHSFTSVADEIDFFKNFAPEIYAQFIYYRKLYNIHARIATASIAIQKKHLRSEHKKISYFYCANVELLSYYATGMNDRDELLFTRELKDVLFATDDYAFAVDTRICPVATYKIAKMKAYKRVESDILLKLRELKQEVKAPVSNLPQSVAVKWTASKTMATELVYAFFPTGVFNNGQAKLKDIVYLCEHFFQLNLNDYQRIYQSLKMRKKSRTAGLMEMVGRLEEKMDAEDT